MHSLKRIIICRCEEVTAEDIQEAIRIGARTVAEVKKMTGAGMGLCQGRICSRLVARILLELTCKKLEEIIEDTSRFPARPVAVSALAGVCTWDES